MTNTGARPPEGSRRGDILRQVAGELGALRRDVDRTSGLVREHGGLLAEALPRLDTLTSDVAKLRGTVAALTAEAEEEDERQAADLAARRAVGMAPEPPGPWAWPILDHDTATAAWDSLARWVGEVFCAWYAPTRGELPDCWPLHRRAVLELTWLRQTHVDAHARHAPGHLAAEWHGRWLPAALAGVAAAIDPEHCPAGRHLIDPRDRTRRVTTSERDRSAAEPATPERWQPHLCAAVEADVATRPAQNSGSSS
ncbi:hypothetical protein [Actinomycetospora flava]|uniref:DUF4913 domain-containing protein n=1 Tax=Actinomycetospora flava TaxID=3129232 RepID=A0ABU8MF28_9PSEU